MMQPGMNCTRINQMCKSHLVNITQPLINRMRYNLQDQWMINSNKPINRIVDDLAYHRHCCCVFVKDFESTVDKSTIRGVNKLHLTLSSNKRQSRNGDSKNSLGG